MSATVTIAFTNFLVFGVVIALVTYLLYRVCAGVLAWLGVRFFDDTLR